MKRKVFDKVTRLTAMAENYAFEIFYKNALYKFTVTTGWPQSRRKKFPVFSRLFQSHNYTFHRLSQQNFLAIWQHLA